MFKEKAFGAFAAASAAIAAPNAQAATVINFTDAGNATSQVSGNKIVSGDYQVTCPGFGGRSECVFMGAGNDTTYTNGSYSPTQNYTDIPLIFSRVDGSAFLLQSFDISKYAPLNSPNQAGRATITFNLASGETQTTFFNLGSAAGFNNVIVNENITSVQIASSNDDAFEIDNFRIDEPAAGAVPETATWAMMIAGLGAVGASLRRRKGLRLPSLRLSYHKL